MKMFYIFILCVFPIFQSLAQDTPDKATPKIQSWFLPTLLSAQNTKVTFELDSTWHTVHGVVVALTGDAKLKDVSDPRSVVIDIRMQVANFDTDNGMRDSKMRDVMDAKAYPEVRFQAEGLSQNCTPALVLKMGECDDVLFARVTIRGTTKEYKIPVAIRNEQHSFIVSGKLPLEWMKYGVEDPSIFIATVDPVVTVFFEVTLSKARK